MLTHRKALLAAAAVAAVFLAGAVAVGANVGILDSGDGGLGKLAATSATTSGPNDVAFAERPTPAAAAPDSASGAPQQLRTGDEHEEREHEEHEGFDRDHRDANEHHEYEGHDDDD